MKGLIRLNCETKNGEEFIFGVSLFLLGIILCYNFKLTALIPSLIILAILRVGLNNFAFFLIGFFVCFLRLQNLEIQTQEKMEKAEISGIVEKTFFKNGGLRALISDVSCSSCLKIIASFRNEEKIQIGDTVFLKGYIIPLPKKVYPYFYDVEAKNKFQKIGAYVSVREFEIIKNGGFNVLQVAKNHVLNVISKMQESKHKSVAIALILGDKGKIEKEDYNAFKRAGLSHVLAISGLHMSICAGLIFAFFFKIFAFTPLALKCDTKRISAVIGLFFGMFYLFLANVPISGLRSFLMVFFVFSGYIFYRGSFGIRGLALALLFILFFWPEEVLFPSFQLSFVAVLCLLKCYNFEIKKYGFFYKILNAGLVTIISSTLVSILTAPFGIHHFGFIHFYGTISNVIAIPMLAIIIMPLAILSILTNFQGVINAFEFSIKTLFSIAEFVSNLPFSAIHMNYFNGYLLTIFSFGLIFFLTLKESFKILGLSMILGSLGFYFLFTKKPFMVVNQDYAILKDGENYVSLFYIPESYLKEIWEEKLNAKFIPFNKSALKDFSCSDETCFNFNENPFTIVYNEISNLEFCTGGILINMSSEKRDFNCHFKQIITIKDLQKNGITPFVF
jgi:ComEC/Rec2-related protein